MSHVHVVPADGRLLNDRVVVWMWVLIGIDSPIVEPVSNGAAKCINEAWARIYLGEPGADGIDVSPAEFQSRWMITKYHMGRGFFFATQATGIMSLSFPSE